MQKGNNYRWQVDTITWDRANRQLTAPGNTSYAYDGLGNRVQKTVSSVVTDYLLDIQPGLTKVLTQTTSGNTDRFVHGMHDIHAMEDNSGHWSYLMQDGLGSVRAEVDTNNVVLAMQNYEPYGDPFGANGTFGSNFGFTGEQTDGNGQVYLRARYYNPDMGVFATLDPFEGKTCISMSLNGYSWVEGNSPNMVDPSGAIARSIEQRLPQILNYSICAGQGVIQYLVQGPGEEGFGECVEECTPRPFPPLPPSSEIVITRNCITQCVADSLNPLRLYANRLTPNQYINTDNGQCILSSDSGASYNERIPNNAVDALALLIARAGQIYPSLSKRQILDNVSRVLLSGDWGTFTVFTEAIDSLTDEVDHHILDMATGLHEDYNEEGQKLGHFWAFFNTEAQGGSGIVFLADVVHECWGLGNAGSLKDARLSTIGSRLGELVSDYSLNQLVLTIFATLSNPWGFVFQTDCLSSYYYNIVGCRSLAVDHHLDLAGNTNEIERTSFTSCMRG